VNKVEKIGVALGGGGIVGCSHLGILQALVEEGIPIHCLTGSSSGAIVAALYAYGYSPEQLINIIPSITKRYIDIDYFTFLKKLVLRKGVVQGLIKGNKIHNFIAEKTKNARLSQLQLPAAFLSADLGQARQVIFASRSLGTSNSESDVITDAMVADAVQASFSIPVLFRPVLYQNRVLVDGGIIDNCPVETAKALGADKVIAIDLVFVNPVTTSFPSMISVLSRVVSMNLALQGKQVIKNADIILKPNVETVVVLDFSRMMECIECGYIYTKKRISEIKKALESASTTVFRA
jgi:NTE family protein